MGSDLLVKPVVTEGATSVDVYFPGGTSTAGMEGSDGDCAVGLWYDVETLAAVKGEGAYRSVDAPMEKIPVYQRGGSIIPRCDGHGGETVQIAMPYGAAQSVLDVEGLWWCRYVWFGPITSVRCCIEAQIRRLYFA